MMDIRQKLEDMTLEEKIDIISDVGNLSGHSVERLGIKGLKMADGPSGIRGYTGNDLSDGGNVAFPTPSALAATWNRDIVRLVGEGLGRNCLYRNVDLLLAPGVNMNRTPICGRNFEYFSEDPVLAAELGSEYIIGVQETGVGTCVKHYAANNQEKYRRVINAEIDERTLREIYLAAFEMIIRKANPVSLMCAYNKVNGHYCSENKKLLTDILRDEWGYEGTVISDWGAVHNSAKALAAGIDYEMPRGENMLTQIKEGLNSGLLTEERLNDAVSNMLKLMNKIKSLPKAKEPYDRKYVHNIARKAAEESIVLLKNEGVLPLDISKHKKIGVLGFFAQKPTACVADGSGGVSVAENSIESALEYIKAYTDGKAEITYEPLYSEMEGTIAFGPRIRAQEIAKKSDALIVFVGNHPFDEIEGDDRDNIELPKHMILFADETARYCKNSIVIMQSGAQVAPFMRSAQPNAIIQMWFNGEGAGGAIADVLFGHVNPSGKLPFTFMKKINENLNYPGDGKRVSYDEKMMIGYRYYDKHPEEVWYPFGFGLSYTTFDYSDISISQNESDNPDEIIKVKCKIKNTGDVAGKEVVQLYVSQDDPSVLRPIKELKDFKKVFLNPGEEQELEFTLDSRAFSYYNTNLNDWHVESGVYTIMIAASSTDIRLSKKYRIEYKSDYSINRKSWYDYFGFQTNAVIDMD